MLVRLGSRGSRLALTQAELVADALRGASTDVDIAIVPITTAGDRDRSKPPGEIGARGVFVKEIEEALLAGRIDVAVHSAKDMTSSDTDGLVVGAYLRREDPRDALCGAGALGPGCGSARPRSAGARSCCRSSRASRSSRCAATSTPACESGASEASTRSCSRRQGSSGSVSPGNRASLLRRGGASGGRARRRRAAGPSRRGGPRSDARRSGDARAGGRRARLRLQNRRGLSRAGRRLPRRPNLTALVADEDGAWLERRSGSDPVKLADELLMATASLRG